MSWDVWVQSLNKEVFLGSNRTTVMCGLVGEQFERGCVTKL